MLTKIVIANRGEVALRILRACQTLGIQTVAVHSTEDAALKHVKLANETVCIGPAMAEKSYLNIPAIISAAEITNADSIHPGYGFLSENADFAERVQKSGFVFIGPSPQLLRLTGNKISAIQYMQAMNMPCIKGSNKILSHRSDENLYLAQKIGYPLIIKATYGGGGRGIQVVDDPKDLLTAISFTQSEARANFKEDSVYMEKYLAQPRHIEMQILSDGKGHVISLGDRDCSIQRRHQKMIEEAPAVGMSEIQKNTLNQLCIKVCQKLKYQGIATFEFLYEAGQFYFIEMNPRLQVEHPVTEMITGIDLVQEQLKIASGETLCWKQEEIQFRGHAIECRINAEDPHTFMPSPGKVTLYHPPGGPGIRIDSHLYTGYYIPPYYDSLLAKIIAHGETRAIAIAKLQNALEELVIEGIQTNIPFLKALLKNKEFIKGETTVSHFSNNILHSLTE